MSARLRITDLLLLRRLNAAMIWFQSEWVGDDRHVRIGGDDYFLGADGLLMPVRKGQAPPDLGHFK